MKSFQEYLTESKKTYPFRIKVAGELPEGFAKKVKEYLGYCKASLIEKSKTPIQTQALDFPDLNNVEVHVFEVVCEYPTTAPQIIERIKCLVPESHLRVRNGGEPAEAEHAGFELEGSGEAILEEPEYDDKVKAKDYFGDDFNKSFLKDLSKQSKERAKEEGKGEYKLPKAKQDKVGVKSAIGS
jgi:hypothetical protein